MGIHLDKATLIQFQSCLFGAKPSGIGTTSDRDNQLIDNQLLLARLIFITDLDLTIIGSGAGDTRT